MKISHSRIYYIVFFLFIVSVSDILSQGKIIGVVKDREFLNPLNDVNVTLFDRKDNKRVLETNTNIIGFFAFNDLAYGIYKIEINLKGFSGYQIENILLSENNPEYIFDTIYISSKQTKITVLKLNDITPQTNIKEEKTNDNLNLSQGKIIGTIRDKKDFTPIQDASILLFKNDDSTKTSGTASDATGFFAFNNLEYGKYRIEISYIGYSSYKLKDLILDNNSPNVYLDTIKLFSGDFKTSEIVVKDEKPEIEFSDDKKVFNVEKMLTSRGGTAIDVLRKLPMVEVDAQDNISLRGSKNLLILIDNKPMKFSSLRQLPADVIKNVEIITNPSAKYEAEGVTGILNIILKKTDNKSTGYNGYLYSGIRSNESFNTGIGMNIKKNKWSFFLNGGLGDFKYKGDNSSNVNYTSPKSFFNSNTNSNGRSKYYFGGAGIEYEINKNHNIGIDSYLNSSKFNNTSNTTSNNFNDLHLLTSFYKNNYSGDGNWDNISASLYYNGKFGKIGKELSFDFTFSDAKNDNNGNQIIQYYDSLSAPVNNTPSKQINITNGKNRNIKIQLDYTNPFNDKTKLETGYKGIFRVNDNDFRSDTLNYSINKFVINNDVTNHFKLSENINAIYSTFSHKIKNFRFKLGLRLEHTFAKGELITDTSDFTKNYIDLFPTLSISQKIGLAHEIQVSYSRRITRPMIYRLNPFVNRYNSKFIYMGNPELSPEYTDSYEASYMFVSNIINITPLAFYRYSKNVISNYSYLIDSNVTVSTYRNYSSGYSYGMDFIISSRAIKWWNINSTFSFYKSKYDANVTSDYSGEEGFSWKANVRSFFVIGNLFNLEIYYDYTGKKINANGFNEPSQSLDISINKSFFNKKLTIGVRGEDLFKTKKWGSETNGIGVKSNYSYSWDSRGIYLNINYNFGNTDKYYNKSKKTKQNENEKSDTSEELNK